MISVIIPCVAKHLNLLPIVLDSIAKQTIKPDEIIVCVSEICKKPSIIINEYTKFAGDIPIQWSCTSQKKFAGANRQRGVYISKGDILVFQDTDDIPHPQRIEITKHFFKTLDCVCLNGLFQWESEFITHDIPNIPYVESDYITSCGKKHGKPYGWCVPFMVHAGNVAVKRDVFNYIHYTDLHIGQDAEFCWNVLSMFNKSIIILAQLVQYNLHLSSWKTK